MPYILDKKNKCIYKKNPDGSRGKRVGCTDKSLLKYLKALQANVKENAMPNDLKSELDFIHRKWPNKSNVSGRTPVVVKTNVPGGNTVFGVQFWTDEMIKTGTSTNTDKTVSKLAATPKWYNNETTPVTESLSQMVRRIIKEEITKTEK